MKIPFHHILLLLFLVFFVAKSNSTLAQNQQKTTRILFLMDGSSSMLEDWRSDKNRFEAASELVSKIADSIQRLNKNVEFAVRIFGHNYYVQDKNCFDSKLEVGFSKQNAAQVALRLKYISPKGVSPIAWSLKEAATQDFTISQDFAYSIILVTDGGESCGGDICATMEQLVNKSIHFRPYIISMIDYDPLKKTYDCMGKFMPVTTENDYPAVIKSILEDNNNFYADKNTVYKPPITKIDTPDLPINTSVTIEPKIEPIIEPKVEPVIKEPVKVEPKTEPAVVKMNIDRIKSPNNFRLIAYERRPIIPNKIIVNPLKTISIPTELLEEEKPRQVVIERINTNIKPFKYSYSTSVNAGKLIAIKPLGKISIPASLLSDAPAPTNNPPKEVTYKASVEKTEKDNPAAPGSVKVYFTNGKGKYYSTEPSIVITNIKTKVTAYNKFRSVSTNKEPNPIELPDGDYQVVVPGTIRKANFSISKGSETKVEIVVDKGSLSFRYNTNNKPPEGFVALVSKRFEPGPIDEHPTEVKREYESSNYHIEINTLPPSAFNIDLVFDEERVITLLKPGTLQVMNTEEIGRVKLLSERGSQFIPFYEMNILGDVEYQILELTPGNFKAMYQIKEANGRLVNKVKNFEIFSDQTNQLTLD